MANAFDSLDLDQGRLPRFLIEYPAMRAIPIATDTSWSWRIVVAAPHRLLFLAGAVQLVPAMLLWFAELAGRSGFILSAPPALTLVSTWAHVLLMLYGTFSFFIFGFLFTVYPRWTGTPGVPAVQYLPVFALTALGVLLIYLGLFAGRGVLGFGLLLTLAGWLTAVAILLAICYRARARGLHETALNIALVLGSAGLASFLYAVVASSASAYVVAREIGVWGFLVPVLLTVSHRMIPFFTQSALMFTITKRLSWGLPALIGASMLHGVLELAGWIGARLVVDVALAALAFHYSGIWGLRRSFAARLVAVLHIAFLWFGIAMTLYALQAAYALTGIEPLGRAPLHALSIGFVTGMLIAMATRVTLGHSGRPLAADTPTWYVFLGLNTVALTRIAAEFFPAAVYQAFNLIAAAGWLVCLTLWAAHYAPIYLRQRADRQPG